VGEPEHEKVVDALPLFENWRFILGRYDGGKRYRRLRTPRCSPPTLLPVIFHLGIGARSECAGGSTCR
jgi:hypothetical protein